MFLNKFLLLNLLNGNELLFPSTFEWFLINNDSAILRLIVLRWVLRVTTFAQVNPHEWSVAEWATTGECCFWFTFFQSFVWLKWLTSFVSVWWWPKYCIFGNGNYNEQNFSECESNSAIRQNYCIRMSIVFVKLCKGVRI